MIHKNLICDREHPQLERERGGGGGGGRRERSDKQRLVSNWIKKTKSVISNTHNQRGGAGGGRKTEREEGRERER